MVISHSYNTSEGCHNILELGIEINHITLTILFSYQKTMSIPKTWGFWVLLMYRDQNRNVAIYARASKYWDGYGTGYHNFKIIVAQLNLYVTSMVQINHWALRFVSLRSLAILRQIITFVNWFAFSIWLSISGHALFYYKVAGNRLCQMSECCLFSKSPYCIQKHLSTTQAKVSRHPQFVNHVYSLSLSSFSGLRGGSLLEYSFRYTKSTQNPQDYKYKRWGF